MLRTPALRAFMADLPDNKKISLLDGNDGWGLEKTLTRALPIACAMFRLILPLTRTATKRD